MISGMTNLSEILKAYEAKHDTAVLARVKATSWLHMSEVSVKSFVEYPNEQYIWRSLEHNFQEVSLVFKNSFKYK